MNEPDLVREFGQVIARRGLDDYVRFVGPQSHSELPNWYRAADLVVLSSWSEGLPNVLREAVSCGRPFVSTDVGSVRELADPRGGPAFAELVPIRDAAAMAAAIERALRPEYRAAAQRFPRRSWRDTAHDLVTLLQRLGSESSAVPRSEDDVEFVTRPRAVDASLSQTLEAVTV